MVFITTKIRNLIQNNGKPYEILDTKLFGPEIENGVGGVRALLDEGPQGVAKGLAALVEGSLDDLLEESLVAAEFCAGVAPEPDYCRVDLRRRVEGAGAYAQDILNVVPGLKENRKMP